MDRLVNSYGDFHPSGSYNPSSSTFKGLPRHHLIFGCGSLHESLGEISLTMVVLGPCLHIWHNIISSIRGEVGYVNFKMPLKTAKKQILLGGNGVGLVVDGNFALFTGML